MKLAHLTIFVIASIARANSEENGAALKSIDAIIGGFIPSSADGSLSRDGKTLVNTFPFNRRSGGDQGHEHHAHHGDHHNDGVHIVDAQNVDSRAARQRNRNRNRGSSRSSETDGGTAFADVAAAFNSGQRCIDKIEMEEHTEYDDAVTCQHSYSQQCHQSYVTDYKPAQKEECDDNFVKNCHIEYKKTAVQEEVNVCIQQQICEGDGPKVPKKVCTTSCETRYEIHEVDDDVVNCETIFEKKCEDATTGYTTTEECTTWPVVKCDKKTERKEKWTPITDCKIDCETVQVPGGCILKPGDEVCHDEVQTVVNPKPVETCTLDPQQVCRHVTVLVPSLKPHTECVDVPKEVCSRSRTNPHIVTKPVVKKWCYTPTDE